MKRICFLFIILISIGASAQNVVGYWYGTGNVVNAQAANNYLVELILKQNKSAVQGILNYYFRNTFRSMQVNGNYNAETRQFSLVNIPVPYFGSNAKMEVDCP